MDINFFQKKGMIGYYGILRYFLIILFIYPFTIITPAYGTANKSTTSNLHLPRILFEKVKVNKDKLTTGLNEFTSPILTGLSLSTGTLAPAFSSNTTQYSVVVPNETASTIITASTSDPNLIITIYDGTTLSSGKSTLSATTNLIIGDNKILVKVFLADKSDSTTYTINVNRAPLRDATLASLKVTSTAGVAYSIAPNPFDPAIGFYTLNVDYDVAQVIVKPTVKPSNNSTFTINGTNYNNGDSLKFDLTLGQANTVTIVVRAQDNITTNTYVLTVTRAAKANQTLTFGALPIVTYGVKDFDPGATNSSGLPITYTTDNEHIAYIVDNKIHVIGVGTVGITATIPSSQLFKDVPPITQFLKVNPTTQHINSPLIPTLIKGNSFDLSGFSASSGLPLTFNVSDNTIVAHVGNTLVALRLGTITLTVSQAGNDLYKQAETLTIDITVDDLLGTDIQVYPAVTPNGDGINDFFLIEGLSNYKSNSVTIANTYGSIIYSATNYNNNTIRFDGHLNGQYLPSGTYFYFIEFVSTSGEKRHKTGYIVLKY